MRRLLTSENFNERPGRRQSKTCRAGDGCEFCGACLESTCGGILNHSRRKGAGVTNRPQPSAGCCAVIHLLDSAQGHPLQTWQFKGQDLITIGRNEGNDVVLADRHVSRAHATVAFDGDRWTLVSIGRHGTIIDDRRISEARLTHQTIFRLGTEGPSLRFDTISSEATASQTIDNFSVDTLAMLEVDEVRTQQEVHEIVENELFQELKEQTRRRRVTDMDETATS